MAKGAPGRRRRGQGDGGVSKYETKSGDRWRITYTERDTDGQPLRKRSRGGFSDENEAKQALRKVLVEISDGLYLEPSETRLKDYAGLYLDGLYEQAESTLQGYRKILRNHIAPHIGHLPLSKIRAVTLAKLYKDLRTSGRKEEGHKGEPLSPNTVRKVHNLLTQILDAAVGEQIIKANPARTKQANAPRAKEVKAAAPEIDPWTVAEVRAFLAWSEQSGNDLHVMWLLALNTGLRRGELAGLKWRDLDVKNMQVSVRRSMALIKDPKPRRIIEKKPKNGKSRVVDLDADTVAALSAWRTQLAALNLAYGARDAWIFPMPLTGNVRDPEHITRRWATAMRLCRDALGAGAPHTIRLHDLRHTHATVLLEAGVHPKVVQERLGHSTIAITLDLYSHVIPSMQRSAVQAFTDHMKIS